MDYDNKYILVTSAILIPFIIFTTILHHIFPEVLQVPDTLGPYLMDNILLDLVIMDVGGSFVAILVLYHGFKTQGKFKAICFLYGSIIFTGFEECYWILTGRISFTPFGTYYFTKGGLWFIEIPLYTCLGWFVLAWGCVFVSQTIFPKRGYIFHSMVAGGLAVSLDLFLDPVMVNLGSASVFSDSMGMWVWLTEQGMSFSIFSIPFFNFFGWYLVVVLFAILYGFVLNDEKIEKRGKTKSALIFFALIPVFLGICFGLIYLMSIIILPFLGGVNLIPIGVL